MINRFSLINPESFFEEFDKDLRMFESFPQKRSRFEENEDHYHLSIDIPGIDKKDLNVELENNVLSISGERKDHVKNENNEIRKYAQYSQKFSLPELSNLEQIEVKHNNGVLDVIIPKKEAQSSSIKLDVSEGKSSFLERLLA